MRKAKAMRTVGIMSPGDMGHAIGRRLGEHGVRVITCLKGRSARAAPGMPPKAHRWIGEMEEIAAMFEDQGLTPKLHEGAADFYRFVAGSPLGAETPEAGHQGQTLDDLVAALAEERRPQVTDGPLELAACPNLCASTV